MTYLILLVLGLFGGAVFLVVLLIGDKRESRLAAQKQALQEQLLSAHEPVEGAWPPPPSQTALLPAFAVPSARPALRSEATRKMVNTFFRLRNYTLGTVFLAYLFYSCFPQFNFGWVLLTTAGAAIALAAALTLRGRLASRQGLMNREDADSLRGADQEIR